MSFTTDQWKKLILHTKNKKILINHKYLELCVMSHVADELRSKDLFITGSDSYEDHRKELMPWSQCKNILDAYCEKTNIPKTGTEGVKVLKAQLIKKAEQVDQSYPDIAELTIDKNGNPTLHKREPNKKTKTAAWLEKTLKSRMKERNLIDVFLCHVVCGKLLKLSKVF